MPSHAHQQDPQPAENFTAGSTEALSHRLDRLPGRRGLAWTYATFSTGSTTLGYIASQVEALVRWEAVCGATSK